MATLLAKRTQTIVPLATNDEVQEVLIADPTIQQFPSYNNQINNIPFGSTSNINQSDSGTPVLTGAAPDVAAGDSQSLVAANETWVNKNWRPVAGWIYLLICAADFLIFPILWSLFQANYHGQVSAVWQPLTLQGGGLIHLSFGTLLGVTSYGRTREKLAGVN